MALLRILLVGSLLALALGPLLAEAVSFSSPFGSGDTTVLSVTGLTEIHRRATPSTGLLELSLIAVGVGSGDVVARLGSEYPINSGETLNQSFTTSVSAFTHAFGAFACGGGGPGSATAKLRISLRQEVFSNGAWTPVNEGLIQEFNCLFLTDVNTEANGASSFSFEPGKTYRLGIQARGLMENQAQVVAQVNFFDTTRGVRVNSVTVPNQIPRPLFHDQRVWFVTNYLTLGTAGTGIACDYDGTITRVVLTSSGILKGSIAGNSPCLSVTGPKELYLTPLVTDTYKVCGTDNEGAEACDVGTVHVMLLPFGPFEGGLDPPLIPSQNLGRQPTILFGLSASGEVLSAELLSQMPVTLLFQRSRGDVQHSALVTWNLDTLHSAILVDGVPVWTGQFAQSGDDWWNLQLNR